MCVCPAEVTLPQLNKITYFLHTAIITAMIDADSKSKTVVGFQVAIQYLEYEIY